MITVFTPTYNRAYILTKLYRSLCNQTCKQFEWIIVDDGSTDNTSELIGTFIQEGNIEIVFVQQFNGGKHRAINRGVGLAKGDLFFIVDSDDQLTEDAIEQILRYHDGIKDKNDFAGVCGLKAYFDGRRVGGDSYFTILDCSNLEFRYKYKIKGDMAEVIRTDVMKEFPFPEFAGEKFCSEAVVWNRMAQKYKIRYFYKNIYLCDYLEDGLTASITKIRMKSPQASMLCYSELFHYDIPVLQKIKAAVNYWRFGVCGRLGSYNHIRGIGWGILLFPIGVLYHLIDLRR